jgi:hypothetical protein
VVGAGPVAEEGSSYVIFVGISDRKSLLGRPKCRRQDSINLGLWEEVTVRYKPKGRGLDSRCYF